MNGSTEVVLCLVCFPHILSLDANNVWIGKVYDEEGMAVVRSIEACGSENGTLTVKEVRISSCGLMDDSAV